jgi:hypothetical protein
MLNKKTRRAPVHFQTWFQRHLAFGNFTLFKKNKTTVCAATLLFSSFQVFEPTPHLIIFIGLLLAEPVEDKPKWWHMKAYLGGPTSSLDAGFQDLQAQGLISRLGGPT